MCNLRVNAECDVVFSVAFAVINVFFLILSLYVMCLFGSVLMEIAAIFKLLTLFEQRTFSAGFNQFGTGRSVVKLIICGTTY